ncbi:chromosome (plasmid) partitioning protein ParB [Vibrio astriarenae]|nr:chromosome (plasmid) partitioning protein ParB [Vibrio sp. C7]
MQAKLESGEAEDQKALAKIFQCSEALVSGALKAADLPLELLQAYPNVAELGRPTIVKLHKQFNEMGSDQQSQLLAKCHSDGQQVWQRSEAQGVARLTKEVSETIENWISELNPTQKPATKKVDLVKGKVSYSRKGNAVSLNMKKVDEETLNEILAFIESKF